MEFVKSIPGNDPIVVEGYFAVPPPRVFAAWTDPQIVPKWFGVSPDAPYSASIDLRPGGAWKFVKTDDGKRSTGFEGQYLDIEPDKKLVFSWSYVVDHANGERDATPFSRVEIEFTPKGKGTYVRIVHSAVRSEDARKGIGGGWEMSFSRLSALLELPA